jgi:hypothetical protein
MHPNEAFVEEWMSGFYTPTTTMYAYEYEHDARSSVPSARLTLHSTKLCTKFKIFGEKLFFVTKITSEAFLSISQNLKVTRLQGCTQTKL